MKGGFFTSIGTEQAEAIFRKYADMIYRIAVHSVKSTADAEDILQDVCLAALTKLPEDRDESFVKAWLIRVTINKCNSFHRLFFHRKRESLESCALMPAPEPNGVMEEIFQLPRDSRIIIYLYYYEEYTIAEIAEMLGKNPNTVGSALRRARQKLKKILTEGGNNDA